MFANYAVYAIPRMNVTNDMWRGKYCTPLRCENSRNSMWSHRLVSYIQKRSTWFFIKDWLLEFRLSAFDCLKNERENSDALYICFIRLPFKQKLCYGEGRFLLYTFLTLESQPYTSSCNDRKSNHRDKSSKR